MRAFRKAGPLASLLAALAACGTASEGAAPLDGGFVDPPSDASIDIDAGFSADATSDAASPPSPLCNDHDPCTTDRYESGTCVFSPAPDGRPCDDGNFCTLGDHCEAGVCAPGTAVSGPLSSLGVLKTLGGGGMGAIGNRFLSITGPSRQAHLELTERQGGKLATLATWDGALPFYEAAFTLVRPLEKDLVAIGGRGERTVSVFSVDTPSGTPGSIVKRSETKLEGQLNGLDAHGSRIWICTHDFFGGEAVSLIDTSDPDSPVVVGSMPLPNPCGSLVVSDDGERVYVTTSAGVRYIDAGPLSSGGDPTLSDVIAPPSGLSVGNGYLVLRGSALRILKQSDLSEVASLPVSGAQSASIVGDRLFAEGWRKVGGGVEAYATLYGGIGSASPARLDEIILETRAFTGDIVPVYRTAIAANGSAVITGDGQRLFELGTSQFLEVPEPRLTPFHQVFVSSGGVRAVGSSSSALIDVSDATAPKFLGGRSFGRPNALEVRLEEGAAGAHLLFGTQALAPRVATGRSWEPAQLPVERWSIADDGQVQVAGSFRLPNVGSGELLIAGEDLFRFRHASTPDVGVTLLGWPLGALGRAGESAQPEFTLQISPKPTPPGDGWRSAFHADALSRRAVVATGTNTQARITWLDLTSTPPAVLEEVTVDGPADDIRIAGTRAVLSTGLELVWLELGKGVVGRDTPVGDIYVPHILGFDGRTTYYASSFPRGIGTALFGSTASPAPTALSDEPSALIETDRSLVVALPAELITLHPQCE